MVNVFNPETCLNSIQLPPQDMAKLEFCASNKAQRVHQWANDLRATKINQTSAILYRSIPQINRLKTEVGNRFEMLEAVRNSVQNCIVSLTKDFLQQPVVLPINAQKTAIVAQALQKSMLTGYIICARDVMHSKRIKSNFRDIFLKSLHRAITGMALLSYRSYQLYTVPPPGLWQQAHVLFQLAEYFDLVRLPVQDNLLLKAKANSIHDAYSRLVLLGCARVNQINQTDIDKLYLALESWAQHVQFNSPENFKQDNLFIIDLSSDQAPQYKSRLADSPAGHTLELDISNLLGQLSKQSGNSDNTLSSSTSITIPDDFSEALQKHLLNAWGASHQRSQERRTSHGLADICIGLTDCHYHLCGEQTFADFQQGYKTGIGEDLSGFDTDFPSSSASPLTPLDQKNLAEEELSEESKYRVTVQNISAGGFCLLWQGEVSKRLQAGELIAIKEHGKPTWNLGVTRWIRQLKQASQVGVQILANQAKPCAVALMYGMGGHSEYMRAFLLPMSKITGHSTTLLTLAAPFQQNAQIRLKNGDKVTSASLSEAVLSTSAVCQFTFQSLDSGDDSLDPAQAGRPKDFDSEW